VCASIFVRFFPSFFSKSSINYD